MVHCKASSMVTKDPQAGQQAVSGHASQPAPDTGVPTDHKYREGLVVEEAESTIQRLQDIHECFGKIFSLKQETRVK